VRCSEQPLWPSLCLRRGGLNILHHFWPLGVK
jgi:hypothetical protein